MIIRQATVEMFKKKNITSKIAKIPGSRGQELRQWENEGGSMNPNTEPTVRSNDHKIQTIPPVESFRLLEAVPLGILVTDEEDKILYSNPAYQKISGSEAETLFGTPWHQTVDPRDRAAVNAYALDNRRTGKAVYFEARLLQPCGQLLWTQRSIASVTLEKNVHALIHTIEDITDEKALDQETSAAMAILASERERARVTLECIGDAVISTDANGRVSFMNPVAEQLTGWTREKAQGRPFDSVFTVVDSNTREPVDNPAQGAIDTAGIVQLAANSRLLRPDGSELEVEDSAAPIFDSTGLASGAVVIFRDRKFSRATASKMFHLARHDPLTGLANRAALTDHFEQALKLAHRHQGQLAVLFMDLDHFKDVNDALGHDAGDELLKSISRDLTSCVRETDTVCRYGGDEFVILLSEIEKPEDAARVAEEIRKVVGEFLARNNHENISLSIGIAVFPKDGNTADLLLQRADTAMYRAKVQGEGAICLFQSPLLLNAAAKLNANRTVASNRDSRSSSTR